ncbi:MAG: hypothetical protein IJX31_05345 [Clostridia bacterium]|nr:hypothetical protein [Clostridia bacterium]
MKKVKGILSLSLVLMMCGGLATGCSGGGGGGGYQEVAGKTNIRVGTYNGGVGKAWLEDAARAFEQRFENRSFEEGKTGVAISVEYCDGGDMMEAQNLNRNVYLTEVFNYSKYVNMGKLADISDVVTEDLGDVGESGKTIQGKLDSSFQSFLTANDGNYYAIPFYEGFMGFIYDVDLFASRGYFLTEDGEFTGDETNLSTGIDGVPDTWDDGMPKTYSQFNDLIEKIRSDSGITPIVYGESDYWWKALTNYWADYEGKDNMLKNWNFTGEFDRVTGFNGDTPTVEKYTFDQTDLANSVKELQKQPGKYYALKFLQEIVCGNANNYEGMELNYAQEAFIGSNVYTDETQYALLLEGAWWENEADIYGAFDSVSYDDFNYNPADGTYRNSRRFAMMPVPMADEVAAQGGTHKSTLYSGNDAFCFISSNTQGAQLDVSKLFMKFLHTDAQMSAFTAKTSLTRALDYTIQTSDAENMSYFAKQIMKMKKASDVVYPYSGHEYYLRNSDMFMLERWGWISNTDKNPFIKFVQNSSATAKSYFNGLYH